MLYVKIYQQNPVNRYSPEDFIKSYSNAAIITDCLKLLDIFSKLTGYKGVLWTNKIGFGKYHYKSKASQGDWFVTGFAPSKVGFTIYSMAGYQKMTGLLEKLGKHKISSGSCLLIKKLEDVDQSVLEQIITIGVKYMKENNEIL